MATSLKINFNGQLYQYGLTVTDTQLIIHCCARSLEIPRTPILDPIEQARRFTIEAIMDGRLRDPDYCDHAQSFL